MVKSNIRLITETLKIQPSFIFVHIPKIVIFLSSLSLIAIVTTTFTTYVIDDNNNAYAQNTSQEGILNSANKINIDANSVTFAPLTDSTTNQLKILVNYQTTDPALVNTPMAGIMKVFLSDDSLLKTSSIPKGYVVGQSGVVQFATSFADQTIKNVRAEIYMIDTQDKVISNTISMDATLIK
jgi:hypothetical protein